MCILISLKRHLVFSVSKNSNKIFNLIGNLYKILGIYISTLAKS